MSKKTKGALRDLGIAVAAAVLGILLPAVAAHGVFDLQLPDVKSSINAGATAALLWAVAWVTPLTRRYGVGSEPVVTSPVPVDTSPPESVI